MATILDEKKTLRFMAAFILDEKSQGDLFRIGKTVYKYISTVNDKVNYKTLVIVMNMNTLKYETLNASDDKVGRKIVELI